MLRTRTILLRLYRLPWANHYPTLSTAIFFEHAQNNHNRLPEAGTFHKSGRYGNDCSDIVTIHTAIENDFTETVNFSDLLQMFFSRSIRSHMWKMAFKSKPQVLATFSHATPGIRTLPPPHLTGTYALHALHDLTKCWQIAEERSRVTGERSGVRESAVWSL